MFGGTPILGNLYPSEIAQPRINGSSSVDQQNHQTSRLNQQLRLNHQTWRLCHQLNNYNPINNDEQHADIMWVYDEYTVDIMWVQ